MVGGLVGWGRGGGRGEGVGGRGLDYNTNRDLIYNVQSPGTKTEDYNGDYKHGFINDAHARVGFGPGDSVRVPGGSRSGVSRVKSGVSPIIDSCIFVVLLSDSDGEGQPG